MTRSFTESVLLGFAFGSVASLLAIVLSIVVPRRLFRQFAAEASSDLRSKTQTASVVAMPADSDRIETPPVALADLSSTGLHMVLWFVLVLTSCLALMRWGLGMRTLASIFFCTITLTLAHIDARTGLLPDLLTLPLMVMALLAHATAGWWPLGESAAGAALAYGVLRAIFGWYYWKTGIAGMGFGDFKLAAALGAWLGVQAVPALLLLASLTGVLFGVIALYSARLPRATAFPFGPFLAVAGILILFWGPATLWPRV